MLPGSYVRDQRTGLIYRGSLVRRQISLLRKETGWRTRRLEAPQALSHQSVEICGILMKPSLFQVFGEHGLFSKHFLLCYTKQGLSRRVGVSIILC